MFMRCHKIGVSKANFLFYSSSYSVKADFCSRSDVRLHVLFFFALCIFFSIGDVHPSELWSVSTGYISCPFCGLIRSHLDHIAVPG